MKQYFFFFVFLFSIVSCKTQAKYDKVAYEEIMQHSIPLLAKEEKNKKFGGYIAKSDTLVCKQALPKAIVDSINNTRKLEYKK